MDKPLSRSASPWTCIWNVFSPFWSISKASGESGLPEVNPLEVYVERPDTENLRDLVRIMAPNRTVEKAIVVGQRGTGKSMDLAWVAHKLGATHLVFWVDAVEEGLEVLQDPIGLFMAMALATYEGARQIRCEPDRGLLEAFLTTCLDTVSREQVSEEQVKFRFDRMLKDLASMIERVVWPVALATAQPLFMVTGGLATGTRMLLSGLELSTDEKDSLKRVRTSEPRADLVAVRLTALLRDIEEQCGRPILIVIDGLDRVEAEQVRTLFQRGRDLARPGVRLILTAPLILYNTAEFDQLQDFFPHVVPVSNIQVAPSEDKGRQFLRRIIQRRLNLCGIDVEHIFEGTAFDGLIDASGGNIRQLIALIRQATQNCERAGGGLVGQTFAQSAINRTKAGLVGPCRLEEIQALSNFHKTVPKLPPGGPLGDALLRRKWILAFVDEQGALRYSLNPLVKAHLEEEGIL